MSLYDRHIHDYIFGKYVEAKQAGREKMFSLTVKGMQDIEMAVVELGNIEKDKAIRSGLRIGGNYLMSKGKARLAQRNYKGYTTKSGRLTNLGKRALAAHNLYNAFRVRVKRRSLGALVGFNYRGHHAHLVDLGTQKRPHPITGTSGVMPANRFWSDTAEHDWNGAIGKVMEGIKRAVYRIKMRRG